MEFKAKRDRSKPNLDDDDRKNLAKAISGFANSGGGVLIWGINDDGKRAPISNVQDFLECNLQLCSQVTDPTVVGIDGAIVRATSSNNDGYVLLLVPESATQHIE